MKGKKVIEVNLCDYGDGNVATSKCAVCGREICDYHQACLILKYNDDAKTGPIIVCRRHLDNDTLDLVDGYKKSDSPILGAY